MTAVIHGVDYSEKPSFYKVRLLERAGWQSLCLDVRQQHEVYPF